MVAWCHLKSPKVWLSNKVNVREAAALEVGLLSANGNQSCFCLLPAVGGTPCDHSAPPLAAETSALQIAPCKKKKVEKSSFSAWFDMTSEVHMPPIPRFLYRMIWYLQPINFPFKQNHVCSVQQFEQGHVGYCCLSGSHVCVVVNMGRETDNWTNNFSSGSGPMQRQQFNFV